MLDINTDQISVFISEFTHFKKFILCPFTLHNFLLVQYLNNSHYLIVVLVTNNWIVLKRINV